MGLPWLLHPQSRPDWEDWEKEEGEGAKWERGAAEAATKAFSEVKASNCPLLLSHPKSCPDWEDWEKEEGEGLKCKQGKRASQPRPLTPPHPMWQMIMKLCLP